MRTNKSHSVRRAQGGVHRAVALLALPVLLLAAGCTSLDTPRVKTRITGAQITTELVESWLLDSQTYRFEVDKPANPAWSTVGYAMLAQGQCDVACTGRPPGPEELKSFGDRQVVGRRVGFFGYALYVHPDNPLDGIRARDMSLVFQGKITDWSQLLPEGSRDFSGPIHLYGPRKQTRGGMILAQHARIWMADPPWTPFDDDREIVARVQEDPLAMGFAAIGYDDGCRYLGIQLAADQPPAFPSLEEIESQRYALATVIFVYYFTPPNEAASAVVDYLFSADGRRAIEQTNVWPLPSEHSVVGSEAATRATTP